MRECKRCPFCDGEVSMESRNVDIGAGDYRRCFFIWCRNNDCPTHPRVSEWGESGYGFQDTQTNEEAKKRVVAAWNTRPET